MSLSEEECSQKWADISKKLSEIDKHIKDIVFEYENISEEDKIEAAKLHISASFAMTKLEKFKLKMSLSSEQLKENRVVIEEDRVEKYVKKIRKAEKAENGETTNRSFRIDANVSKRVVRHHTD